MPIKIKRSEPIKQSKIDRLRIVLRNFKTRAIHFFKSISKKLYLEVASFKFKKLATPQNLQRVIIFLVFFGILFLFYFLNRDVDPLRDYYEEIKAESLLDKSNPVVVIKLDGLEDEESMFALEVYKSHAPFTASHFLNLINSGVYNGLKFDRVQEDLIIQVEDPSKKTNNSLEQIQNVPLEISPYLSHKPFGTLGLSRDLRDPNSGSAQFYITIGSTSKTFLDGSYAIFGQVVKGSETIKKIKEGMVIKQAKMFLKE